jgi:hypothetical protein
VRHPPVAARGELCRSGHIGGNERTLCGAGRHDNLDESGCCVVDQARYDAAAGQGSPGDLDVDAYGGPRVVDLLGVEVCNWYLEELGELLGEGGELLYAAVGVVQNRQVRGAGPWRVVGVALAELREQAPGAQDSRRDAAADVAYDNRFTKVETEHVGWIDTRVDAAEDLESMWRGKGEASECAACGERGVAADQFVSSDRHGASISAGYKDRSYDALIMALRVAGVSVALLEIAARQSSLHLVSLTEGAHLVFKTGEVV